MSKRLLHSTVVLLAIATTGCAAYPGALPGLSGPTPGTDLAGQPLSLSSLPKAGLSGVVMAPAHVVAAGGGNVVAAGGGNVVAAGGGNFAGLRRILALDQQVAVIGAEVYLADLTGERLPGVASAVTDAAGRFTLRGAPEASAYMVVARFQAPGGAVTLTRLGHASRNSHDQVVSVATTLVSAALMQRGNPAGHFDPDTFDAAVAAVADRLSEATLPDLTRPEDVAARAAAIADETPAVRRAIDEPVPSHQAPPAGPLIDEVSGAVPAAPSGGQKGQPNGKADRPSGSQTPSEPAPDATAGEPTPDDTAAPPAAEPESGSGSSEPPAPPPLTPEPPAPPQAEPPAAANPQPRPAEPEAPKAHKPKKDKGADKDKDADQDKNKGKGGKPS